MRFKRHLKCNVTPLTNFNRHLDFEKETEMLEVFHLSSLKVPFLLWHSKERGITITMAYYQMNIY